MRLLRVRWLLTTLLTGSLLAAAGVSMALQAPPHEEEAGGAIECPDPTQGADSGVADAEEECVPSEDGDGEEGDEVEESAQSTESTETEESEETDPTTESTDLERDASCREAAGLGDEDVGSEERLTGLDHTIDVVLANCRKNPQAPGLLVALERLAENRERHEARDEARDDGELSGEEEADEDQASAAESERGHGNGHGDGGNGHGHGHGNGRGHG